MTESTERALLTSGLLGTVALFVTAALGLSRVARLVPLVVGVVLLTLLAVALVQDVTAARAAAGHRGDGGVEARRRRRAELVTFAWMGVLIGLMLLFGMPVGLALYVLLSLRLRSRESGRLSLALAAGLWIVLHAGVQELLGIRLFDGLWPGWFGG